MDEDPAAVPPPAELPRNRRGFTPEIRARSAVMMRARRAQIVAEVRPLFAELARLEWQSPAIAQALGRRLARVRGWVVGRTVPPPVELPGLRALLEAARAGRRTVTPSELGNASWVRPVPGPGLAAEKLDVPRPPLEVADDDPILELEKRWRRAFDAMRARRDAALAIVLDFEERLARLEARTNELLRAGGRPDRDQIPLVTHTALDQLVRDAWG